MDVNAISNRTILRILGLCTLFVGSIWLAFILQRQLMWIFVALFFAVALNPLVEWLRKYLPRKSRGTAAGIVVFGSMAIGLGVLAALLPSMVSQGAGLVSDLPKVINELNTSDAPVAQMLQKYQVVKLVQENQDEIVQSISGFGRPALNVLSGIFGSFIGVLTVMSLTFFILAEGADWLNALRKSRYGARFKEVEPVTTDMYAAVSGYVVGNLVTSGLAAVSSGIIMLALGVPYAIPLALLVGVFDLLPLIGATLGAAIVLFVTLFVSIPTTLIMLVFFLVYQQIENQFIQPTVYAKTVQISPLIVFVAAILGASLAGIIGALVAIPIAASIKIVVSHYMSNTRSTVKS